MTPVYVAMMEKKSARTRELRETDVGTRCADERMRKQRENGDLSERCRNDESRSHGSAEGHEDHDGNARSLRKERARQSPGEREHAHLEEHQDSRHPKSPTRRALCAMDAPRFERLKTMMMRIR